MSTDLKLSKAQISKIIQSGGFLGSLLSKLAVPLMKVAIPLLLSLDWIDIGLLYFVTEMKLFFSKVLVFNMFLEKLKNLLELQT